MTAASKEQMMLLNGRAVMISSPIAFEFELLAKYRSLEILFAAFDAVFMKKDSTTRRTRP